MEAGFRIWYLGYRAWARGEVSGRKAIDVH